MRSRSAILATLLSSFALVAHADEHPTARLVYARDAAASRCPDEEALRDAVSARLGYVPFRDAAEIRVEATIRANRPGLLASVDVYDASGELVGQRTIRSRTRDCEELARGVALAISVAIDPMSLGGPEPTPVPAAPPAAPEPPPAPPPPPEPEPVPEPAPAPAPARETWLGGDVLLAYGTVPSVRPGFALRALHRRERLGIDARLELLTPSRAGDELGSVRAFVVDARVLGCFAPPTSRLSVCGGLYAGMIRGRGLDVQHPRRDRGFLTGLALEGGYAIPVGSVLVLDLRVGLDLPLARASLRLGDAEVWRSAPVSPRLAFGARVSLR